MNIKESKSPVSAFFERFLNNQGVVNLLIILLVFLIIFTFTKISYLFDPIRLIINLLAFPIIGAVVLYYLFRPLVSFLVRQQIDRRLAVWLIFLAFILLIIWGINSLIPVLQHQWESLLFNIPRYTNQIQKFIDSLPLNEIDFSFSPSLESLLASFDFANISNRFNQVLTSTFGGIGNVLGTVSQFIAGFLTMPVILYYLLTEDYKLSHYVLYFLPTKYVEPGKRIIYKSNYQVAQYIRGQIIVALIVGCMFAIGYSIIGLDYGVLLAVIAGFCNVIPYLGSIIAVIPALVIGALTSPIMLVKVILVLSVEQFIEGRFVSPQVLGNNMEIHPLTILFILLIAGRLFGVSGVILGVPVYAILKVLFTEIFQIFRKRSNLYLNHPIPEEKGPDGPIIYRDHD
ncbi:AI-2E family transporter [Hutsoniella sourekii]|uniref:AI-2E family transporter n=1 Tax=Hutsoniella sourekii TaxID=87650 RepID=UPI0004B48A3F|nr:AI-2E family transporter [Hutsoniella sourekii]